MNLTREELKTVIDMYPSDFSGEEVFIDLVTYILRKYPHVLPKLSVKLGYIYSMIFEEHFEIFHLIRERASYLESYLSGRMYPEEVAKKPEYIDIQRGHATTIKEQATKAMGD